jgi:uncharacterized protein YdhG (YjbR/CyaY superfamily)
MDKSNIAPNVDAYLDALPEKQKSALTHLRKIIRETAPTAEEVISYGMPAYKYHGMLVYFAAFKKHCSLFAVNNDVFEEELLDYKTSKGTIQFLPEKTLPDELVRKIVKFRMKANEENTAMKQMMKKSGKKVDN